MDENILKSLDSTEKEILQEGLKSLIEQTYVIENEYKKLKQSYDNLSQMINEIVEVLPTALWVFDAQKNIILQNQLALSNAELLRQINTEIAHDELEFNGCFYLIKNTLHGDKHILTATDISKEKRNERLASMGSVAAHLAHEIRNPIGSISLLADTLFTRSELKNKHIVLEIQKAISRVERIINSTLLFTKGVHINPQIFNTLELKDECEQVINSYNFHSNIDFEIQFLDLEIYADKALLSLVLQNLIYNSIDAIEESEICNGKVQIISLVKEEKDLLVKIYDNGVDIKDESAVFEAFKTTKLKGNGLGLSLCKQIINAHGGKIGFEKEPKCFYFSLGIKK